MGVPVAHESYNRSGEKVTEFVRRSHMLGSGALSCLDWGGAHARDLIFSHANGFNAQTYTSLLAPLADEFRVLACDLRGHGRSSPPATPELAKDWAIFSEDLEALITEATIGPVVLAGHSLGATASLMAAALPGTRVHAVVLAEPVLLPRVTSGTRGPANSLAQMAAQRRRNFTSFDSALDYFRNRGIFARWPEQVVADYLAGGLVETAEGDLRLACSPEWESAIFSDPPLGIAGIVQNVACPLTILRGSVASTATEQEVAEILRLKPDTRVVTVEGASHFLPIEEPERVREEIRRFAAGPPEY
jgi:pimeloyl-ACP methyl ester carboxylesterase